MDALWPVLVHPAITGAKDTRGNTARTWGAGVQQMVFGWAPVNLETQSENRTVLERDLDVYVPPEFPCGPNDQVTVLGVRYNVVGYPADYTHGPFGYAPGGVVSLKRVEESGE